MFTFSLPAGSTPTFLVTDANDALPPGFTPTGSIPEPSTWAMLIADSAFSAGGIVCSEAACAGFSALPENEAVHTHGRRLQQAELANARTE